MAEIWPPYSFNSPGVKINLWEVKNIKNVDFLLRKIALPYPHKCLLGFVEAKRGDQQEYLKIILVREVNPVVSDRCACAQPIGGWTLSRDPHSIFGRRGGCAFFFRRSSWRSHS